MLGVLDERGYPLNEMGVLEMPEDEREPAERTPASPASCARSAATAR
jgi:hypothetical protein